MATGLLTVGAIFVFIHFVLLNRTFWDEWQQIEISLAKIVNEPSEDSTQQTRSPWSILHAMIVDTTLGRSGKKETVPFAESDSGRENPLLDHDTSNAIEQAVRLHETSKDRKRREIASGFFNEVFQTLYRGRPPIPELHRYKTKERIYHARYDSLDENDMVFSEKYLGGFLDMNDTELLSMTHLHQYVMDHLPEHAPKGLYLGNGIVFVGGGKFNWLTLLSIKSLRSLGSTLPIEVLIPKQDEYEIDFCTQILPLFKAKCIYLPYELKEHSLFEFKGYQYKALAILLSSFENVLLLDSDNIPVHAPDELFKREPFKSSGLIVWPDFWKRATSPYYYTIAGLTVSTDTLLPKYNETEGFYFPLDDPHVHLHSNKWAINDIPLHQRYGSIPDPTSESGQLMISKRTHTKPLLLALFYNLYGPLHFYPLFSQGSDGEGDKETFLAATVATGKSFYQVSKFLNAFGYFNIMHEFEGTGMGQYDPVEDYIIVQRRLKGSKEKETPRIMFVHANWPKLNPWTLKITRKIFNEEAKRIRLYGTGMKLRTGYDFELVQWQNMHELLCDQNISLDTYQDVDKGELCKEIVEHLGFLKDTEGTLEK